MQVLYLQFNKPCLFKKVVPKYANVKVPTTSPTALKTKACLTKHLTYNIVV